MLNDLSYLKMETTTYFLEAAKYIKMPYKNVSTL